MARPSFPISSGAGCGMTRSGGAGTRHPPGAVRLGRQQDSAVGPDQPGDRRSSPSEYLSRLQNSAGLTAEQLDGHLRTHLVDPASLRADDLQVFVAARQTALLGRIEQVMGKRIDPGGPAEPEDEPVNYEVVEGYEDLEGDAACSGGIDGKSG